MLTPMGTRPYIKAFCPQTPLKDNFPPKAYSKVVFQRGYLSQPQVMAINAQLGDVVAAKELGAQERQPEDVPREQEGATAAGQAQRPEAGRPPRPRLPSEGNHPQQP